MKEFLEKIAEILEISIEEATLETNFRDAAPYWDSLIGFSIITMIESDYDVVIDVPEFLKCRTIGDLWNKINPKEQ